MAGLWCCVQRGDMRSGDPPLEQRGWVVAFVRYVGPTRALRQVIMLCMRQPKGYLLVMQRRTTLYHPHATPYHPVPPSRNAVPPCTTLTQRRTTLYHPHATPYHPVPPSCRRPHRPRATLVPPLYHPQRGTSADLRALSVRDPLAASPHLPFLFLLSLSSRIRWTTSIRWRSWCSPTWPRHSGRIDDADPPSPAAAHPRLLRTRSPP